MSKMLKCHGSHNFNLIISWLYFDFFNQTNECVSSKFSDVKSQEKKNAPILYIKKIEKQKMNE